MPFLAKGEVVSQTELAPGTYFLKVFAPEIAKASLPGQFVNLRSSETYDPLLRRPLSLHGFSPQTGEISFLYVVKGKGTKWLSRRRTGEILDLLGPLGNGFRLPEDLGNVALVGGGVGIAPLFPLVKSLLSTEQRLFVFWGAKTATQLFRREAFPPGVHLEFATEDGSAGSQGLVTTLLPPFFMQRSFTQVYACGPKPMLREVNRITSFFGFPLQVLLETQLGCGFGACLGCALKLKNGGYARVCTEGPVFRAEEVAWEDEP